MNREAIGVDCQFESDGPVLVRRVLIGGRWTPVTQGRQWVDLLGRHVLVMMAENEAREILLYSKTMSWFLLPAGGTYETRLA